MDLYINNIAPGVLEDQLKELFEPFGEVVDIRINKKSFTKMNKGNAFLRMRNNNEAREAIAALNGKMVNGKKITVNEAVHRAN
jgi:RNA recognition motif-containing protein